MTGAATGIGAATLALLARQGANIFFGDVNADAANELIHTISSEPNTGKVFFRTTDVTKHSDIYDLFKAAYEQFGRIDHAVSAAGIFEKGNWFDPTLDIESLGQQIPGPLAVIETNVIGTAVFARCAVVFMRESIKTGKSQKGESSLMILSSVNAFREVGSGFAISCKVRGRCLHDLESGTVYVSDIEACRPRPHALDA